MERLNADNYHSRLMNQAYWSVSQFKSFDNCEAAALAELRGEHVREETDALLIGSYVDAYFAGTLDEFVEEHRDQIISKRGGGLLAKYQHANEVIEAVNRQPLMLEYLQGEKQEIRTAELFGVPWKIKMDVCDGARIVDLKTVKAFEDVWDASIGSRRSWVEKWAYDVQGAIYQKVEQISSGRPEPLPFYLVAVTKERIPDVKVLQIPQHILDAALRMVEAKLERFDLIKSGDVEPIRCEECDYCKQSKVLTGPEVYEIKEAE